MAMFHAQMQQHQLVVQQMDIALKMASVLPI